MIRAHKSGMNAATLHRELLKIVEMNIPITCLNKYIFNQFWNTLLLAKDETIQMINVAINNLEAMQVD